MTREIGQLCAPMLGIEYKLCARGQQNLKVENNLVPRAMPVRGLGWHWLWGNGMICVRFHTRSLNAHARTDCIIYYTLRIRNL